MFGLDKFPAGASIIEFQPPYESILVPISLSIFFVVVFLGVVIYVCITNLKLFRSNVVRVPGLITFAFTLLLIFLSVLLEVYTGKFLNCYFCEYAAPFMATVLNIIAPVVALLLYLGWRFFFMKRRVSETHEIITTRQSLLSLILTVFAFVLTFVVALIYALFYYLIPV